MTVKKTRQKHKSAIPVISSSRQILRYNVYNIYIIYFESFACLPCSTCFTCVHYGQERIRKTHTHLRVYTRTHTPACASRSYLCSCFQEAFLSDFLTVCRTICFSPQNKSLWGSFSSNEPRGFCSKEILLGSNLCRAYENKHRTCSTDWVWNTLEQFQPDPFHNQLLGEVTSMCFYGYPLWLRNFLPYQNIIKSEVCLTSYLCFWCHM